jgi:hypothetical protein
VGKSISQQQDSIEVKNRVFTTLVTTLSLPQMTKSLSVVGRNRGRTLRYDAEHVAVRTGRTNSLINKRNDLAAFRQRPANHNFHALQYQPKQTQQNYQRKKNTLNLSQCRSTFSPIRIPMPRPTSNPRLARPTSRAWTTIARCFSRSLMNSKTPIY